MMPFDWLELAGSWKVAVCCITSGGVVGVHFFSGVDAIQGELERQALALLPCHLRRWVEIREHGFARRDKPQLNWSSFT
ncbi:hypothetical protein K456DRAFT_1615295 [Colletotrichum gloeosporioides 23]|nr:hypothetical protein K456DRAFT_1615295 [Colletotrichum gloeosporioides 23]